MSQAKEALEHLSQDPKVVTLARERELAAMTYNIVMATERAMARKEGREEGREEQARTAILDLCEVLAIAVSDAQRDSLASMVLSELEALTIRIKREHRW